MVAPTVWGDAEVRAMVAVILYFLLAVFLLIALALLLPVKIFLKAAGGDERHIEVDGRVMFFAGLLGGGGSYGPGGSRVSVYIGGWRALDLSADSLVRRVGRMSHSSKKQDPYNPEKERKKSEKRDISLSEFFRDLRGVARKHSFSGKKALSAMRGLLQVDRLVARIKIGLGDPALTGLLIGIIHAVNGILPARFEIIPAWDFSRRVVHGDVEINLTFRTHLFWLHLVRGFLAHRGSQREQRPIPVDSLNTQEV